MRKTLALLAVWLGGPGPLAAEEKVDYQRDVKPVLSRRCYACHGALKQKAGLRLDTAERLRRGGESGPAVVPGHADDSLVVDAITGLDGWRMPPEGEPLSGAEVRAIKAWIEQGAEAPPEREAADPSMHWAFRAPRRPEVPRVRDAAWVRNPIDAFLAVEHERRGLRPSPPADHAVLLRRVSLDLTGLAPSPGQRRTFAADEAADAYEKAVDRLLASPQYGERWGRHWMDVWRYSDWDGFGAEVRESQPHIWRWRDWIVESLNADKGYDRMVVEMLAADEAAPGDPDAARATGFLVRNWYKFNRNVWLENTVEHTAKAFLGLTINCAKCHDHKYDPIAQEDFYRFRAFFEPHQVRTDRVPGQPDVKQDGLPRVYDADSAAQTFLLARGNEQAPVKDRPLVPGLPAALLGGNTLDIQPVSLPATAYYPGLSRFIREETLARALADVEQKRRAMGKANEALAASRKHLARAAKALLSARVGLRPVFQAGAAVSQAEGAATSAAKALLSARAELAALRAKLAADEAKYATPARPDAEALAREAGRAERELAYVKADERLFQAERAEADVARTVLTGKAKSRDISRKAEKELSEARKGLESARAALADDRPSYAPLGPTFPATSTGRRLALARWIAQRQNPLTARVAVNHVWMRHFGRPLVETVADFGLNGKPPTHPALLDWLAVELMERGWSLKALHRLIVTSSAYRMQSSGSAQDDPNRALDPENRYVWRMNVRRLEAEAVRDNVLHAAGDLDPAQGGADLDPAQGETSRRRSLYFRHAKEKRVTFLRQFDSASVVSCYRRSESVVPQQALALANSPLCLAEARRLAARLTKAVGVHPSPDAGTAFVTAAFEHVLGRAPTADERAACEDYLVAQAQRLADPSRLVPFGSGSVAAAVRPTAEPALRAREDLVHVLLNHNDFVTIH